MDKEKNVCINEVEASKENPRYICLKLFSSPESAAYWIGLAVQIKGNCMYGTVIPLKTKCGKLDDLGVKIGEAFKVAEWEWCGGSELSGAEKEEAEMLYEKIKEKCTSETMSGQMEITISLSTTDLERVKDVLGITQYDDIHTAIVDAFSNMLEQKEKIKRFI